MEKSLETSHLFFAHTMQELTGWIERITYFDEESHYTVAQLAQNKHSPLITLVGMLPSIQVGESIHCHGNWKHHPKHGLQFEVQSYQLQMPTDSASIEKFLASGAIEGIGPAFAAKIVNRFHKEALIILDENPSLLLNIEGFGEKKLRKVIASWNAHKTIREIVLLFQTYGVSKAWAQRIFRSWGHSSLHKLKEDPFQLARQIRGIGFKIADTIAQNLGFTLDCQARVQAGILHVLEEGAQEGHTCIPLQELINRSHHLLQIDRLLITPQLDSLKLQGEIEISELPYGNVPVQTVWSKSLFLTEIGIAKELLRIQETSSNLRSFDVNRAIIWAQAQLKIQLAKNQIEGLTRALSSKIAILTGGPGTGKSTLTQALLSILSQLSSQIILTAPTGRAAKRMSEITHKQASTIHRLLKFDPQTGGFKYNRNHPLPCHVLIIDEASMIDTYLMYHLLKAVPSECSVLIIGDAHQLPSIGPGQVLHDLILSQCISVTHLNHIFRQAAGSKIITNAHRINQGQLPSFTPLPGSDFFFLEAQEPEEIRSLILSLVKQRLPEKYGYHPTKDIQVLCPMKKGPIGLIQLNNDLQSILNTPTDPSSGQTLGIFRLHDKVMQIKNNYSKEVFNGDIGSVKRIDDSHRTLVVEMEDKEVEYEYAELDELTLAYAVSVHKFQGSECPCIIMPVHTAHFKLLTRNLLYTAVTRGKKLVVLVGTKRAVAIAVKSKEREIRHTGLTYRMKSFMPHSSLIPVSS